MTDETLLQSNQWENNAPKGYVFLSRYQDWTPKEKLLIGLQFDIPPEDVLAIEEPGPHGYTHTAYVKDTHLEKMVYFKQMLADRIRTLGKSQITFPISLLNDSREEITVPMLMSVATLNMTENEATAYNKTALKLAGNAMHSILLQTGGCKTKALLIMTLVTIELWWRSMREAEQEGKI